MLENDLTIFNNDELTELLAVLEGLDASLEEQELLLKESRDNNGN